MANVTVEASSNIEAGNRCSVRTSGDFVYVLATSGTSLEMHKGNVAGEPASFDTPIAVTSITGLLDIGGACAIDSNDLIHCIYYQVDTGHGGVLALRYVTFNTGTDTFGTPESIATLDNNASVHITLGIAIDANNEAHVFWRDALTDMGSTTTTIWYSNNTDAGNWRSRVSVLGSTSTNDSEGADIIIGEPTSTIGADRPILTVRTDARTHLNAYHGTALDATAFTEEADITSTINMESSTLLRPQHSMAIDSGGKITIAFVEQSSKDLMIVEHLAASAWTSWVTAADVDTSTDYQNPSIAIDGTNRYIFVEDETNSDLNLWKDEGSGFSEETADTDLPNVGTFADVKVKWSNYNNNSSSDLDYVFEDSSGNVLYNTINVAPSGTLFERTASQTITISHTNPRVHGHVRLPTQTLTHSSSVLRESSTFVRAVAQSLTHSEAIARIQGHIRSVAQAITESDTVARIQAHIRTVAQSLTESDTVLREGSTFQRTASQTLTESDIIARIQGHIRAIAQALTHSESITTVSGKQRTATQTITESDSVTRIQAHIRAVTQILTHSESILREGSTFIRAVSQTITESDSVVAIKGLVRTATQILTHSSSVLREGSTFTRTAIQTITHSSIITRIQAHIRTASQTLTESDLVATIKEFLRTASQSLTHSESITRTQGHIRTATQTLTESDTVTRIQAHIRTVSQNLTHSESIARIQAHIRTVAQTITESDSVVAIKSGTGAFERTVTQTITHSDSVARIQAHIRAASQNLTHSESILRQGSTFIRTATQTLTHLDSVTRIQAHIRTVTQTLIHSSIVSILIPAAVKRVKHVIARGFNRG